MSQLTIQKRDHSTKAAQLRREGFVPAIIYGKHLEESVMIKIPEGDALHFIRGHAIGSQVDLSVDSKDYSVMLKDVTFTPLKSALMHLDFQALTAGETVKVNAHINLLNKDSVDTDAVAELLVQEVELETLPKYLIDHIDVDLDGLNIGDVITLGDLAIAKDDNYNLHTPLDTRLVTIVAVKEAPAETTDVDDDDLAQVPLVGDAPEE